MNKQKQVYLSPETETLVVQVEEMICQSTTGNAIDPGIPDDWGTLL